MKTEFFAFLDERKAATYNEVKALEADGRKDESNALKAKANIYDIFKALWTASERDADFKASFLAKATNIPAQWEKSYELAKAHNDVTKIMIEEAKLAAVSEIMEEFNKKM